MMADLMDQHMAHEARQLLVGLAPFGQDRLAVEIDHLRHRPDIADALMDQRHAVIEAGEVERVLDLHLAQGLLVGELLDADGDVAELLQERLGQRGERILGDLLHLLGRRRTGEAGARRHGAYLGAMRRAPSSRTTVPLSMRFSIMCRTRAANSAGWPKRFGNGTDCSRLRCTSCGMPRRSGVAIRPGATASTRMP